MLQEGTALLLCSPHRPLKQQQSRPWQLGPAQRKPRRSSSSLHAAICTSSVLSSSCCSEGSSSVQQSSQVGAYALSMFLSCTIMQVKRRDMQGHGL